MKIILNKGQKLFMTSDTHYSHRNLCKSTTLWGDGDGTTRDFKSLNHMNDIIVSGINDNVGVGDILVHLGDWSFGGFDNIIKFRKRINCKEVILFLGNHDHHIRKNKNGVQGYFKKVSSYDVLDVHRPEDNGKVDKFKFVCFHYPIASWHGIGLGDIHVHGHMHYPNESKISKGRSIDVGIDGNNFKPYEMGEIIELMDGKPIDNLVITVDYHKEED